LLIAKSSKNPLIKINDKHKINENLESSNDNLLLIGQYNDRLTRTTILAKITFMSPVETSLHNERVQSAKRRDIVCVQYI